MLTSIHALENRVGAPHEGVGHAQALRRSDSACYTIFVLPEPQSSRHTSTDRDEPCSSSFVHAAQLQMDDLRYTDLALWLALLIDELRES